MKNIILGLSISLVSFSSLADEPYFTGEFILGKATQEVGGSDDDDTSFGIRAAYQANKNLAFEISYQDFGEASWSYVDPFGDKIAEKSDTDSFNISLKGILPIDSRFSLFARAGLAFWNLDVDITDSSLPGLVFEGSDSGNDVFYGFGAQYSINDMAKIGVEYIFSEFGVDLDGDLNGISTDLEIDTLAFSLAFSF